MNSARTRFIALAGLLLALLVSGERFAQRSGTLLPAVAHRVNFKLALLEKKGSADFVVLGSSRGNDCVAPGPIGPNGMSVATPSSSLPTLEAIAEQTAATPGLKVALVELSRRQLADGYPDVESPGLDVDARQDPVGALLARHSALLRGRRAFALENWSRLPALIAPSLYDGSEFFHTRWLAEALVRPGPADPAELAALQPDALADVAPPTSHPDWARVSQGYRRVVDAYRRRGVKVLLYGSPLSARRQAEECDEASRRFRAAVAAFAGAPFDDFACAPVPEGWLTDGDEHCGALGRQRFSERLALSVKAHALP
ncbi:MAG: hypothetical protein IPJ65_12080 [Archangiaceae bacterium]|nr:hypothetical protein [Archangiaceae bacterium]